MNDAVFVPWADSTLVPIFWQDAARSIGSLIFDLPNSREVTAFEIYIGQRDLYSVAHVNLGIHGFSAVLQIDRILGKYSRALCRLVLQGYYFFQVASFTVSYS